MAAGVTQGSRFRARDRRLTPSEAAAHAGVTVGRIKHALAAGLLPYSVLAGAKRPTRLIWLSDLERAFAEVRRD